jgi:hypothetical protein
VKRAFICERTGELCERGGCTISDTCLLELEEEASRAARAPKNVASVNRPAWRGTIKEGRRYRLRNGAVVTIVCRKSYSWTSAATGKTEMIEGWLGRVAGAAERITWQLDGWYAPECGVRPHELDIVGTAL